MEPNWTKNISSEAVCNFFYIFFAAYAFFFVLTLLTFIGFGFSGYFKKLGPAGVGMGVQGVIGLAIITTQMLFFYLICDRTLIASKAAPAKVAAPEFQ